MPENQTYFIEQWTDSTGKSHHFWCEDIKLSISATEIADCKTDCYFIIKPKTKKA